MFLTKAQFFFFCPQNVWNMFWLKKKQKLFSWRIDQLCLLWRKGRKTDFLAALFYVKWHLQTFWSSILKFWFKFLFFCLRFTLSNFLFCLFQCYCLIAEAFSLRSSRAKSDFSSHPTDTTKLWRHISCFSKIIYARNQLNSFSVGTAEKTHQSTLLTELAQLMTGCQAHQSLLSAFARLNMKSKST